MSIHNLHTTKLQFKFQMPNESDPWDNIPSNVETDTFDSNTEKTIQTPKKVEKPKMTLRQKAGLALAGLGVTAGATAAILEAGNFNSSDTDKQTSEYQKPTKVQEESDKYKIEKIDDRIEKIFINTATGATIDIEYDSNEISGRGVYNFFFEDKPDFEGPEGLKKRFSKQKWFKSIYIENPSERNSFGPESVLNAWEETISVSKAELSRDLYYVKQDVKQLAGNINLKVRDSIAKLRNNKK